MKDVGSESAGMGNGVLLFTLSCSDEQLDCTNGKATDTDGR